MKKLILSIALAVIAVIANAQRFNFPINDRGEVVITETIKSGAGASANFQKVKTWLNTQTFSNISVNSENVDKNLSYVLTKNTKSRYNPFAGQFTENLIFLLNVEVSDAEVVYTLTNMQVQEIYMGYGANTKMKPLSQIVQQVQTIEKQMADAQAAGDKKAMKALKKQYKDDLEDLGDTLEKISEELNKMLSALKAQF